MRKFALPIILGCMFFLQACVQTDEGENNNMMKEGMDKMQEQLFLKTEKKDAEAVSKLLKEGVDINAKDNQGRTALMIATYNNDQTTAKVLIDAGADVNIQDNMKNTPFLYAGAEGYLEILKLTIDAGADPTITNRYGGTALIPASEHGYVDVIQELLTRTEIDVNHVNNLGWTALMEAIILNDGDKTQQQVVQLLIDHGADVNVPDKDGVNPLQHAKKHGFKEIEEILIEAGAS
ncbi:ankyrin repeat domain-containing protein [Bacillus sp. JJ722]|uniref:ankyrin repeat domain-containing protein n=1 Tax=Bacillus sp. JJ722 TaxID=3122973 RepID=UPI0030005262